MVALALATVACNSSKADGPVPAPDRSLAAAAYVAKGLPPADPVWAPQDYHRAVKVLEELANEDASLLPRFASPQSGAVFARLVSADNLQALRAAKLSPNEQMGLATELFPALGKLMTLYATKSRPEAVFDREVTELMALLLAASHEMMVIGDNFMKTVPADDPRLEARLAGRAKLQGGIGTIVQGCVVTLSERAFYRPAARAQLAAALAAELPRLYPYLLPAARQELPGQLEQAASAETDPELKLAIQRASAALPPE